MWKEDRRGLAERGHASGRDFRATYQEGKQLNPGLSRLVRAAHPLWMRELLLIMDLSMGHDCSIFIKCCYVEGFICSPAPEGPRDTGL